ncbi:hypothetical protein [Oceaniglobus indicus]|uniref:hypothetical protein n=1 Tax=Oceaniglobus indicus TaxID=2047749 RepID=UPI000C1927D0|nr:hypothetical protein [Oceaniglobus indicus]
MNQIIRMLTRMFMNKGINAGIDHAFGQGKARKDMTPEERRQADAGRSNAKRAKQAIKMARRAGRF